MAVLGRVPSSAAGRAGRTGPQLIPAWFNHGTDIEMRMALDTLATLDADLVLPGHGPADRGALRAAVDMACSRT